MRVKIAPSIAAGNLANLEKSLIDAESAGADMIHLDIADGHFAPNITFGPGTVKALRHLSSLPFDTHLMITDPLYYLESFIDSGSDIITAHCEVLDEEKFTQLLERVKSRGLKIGIALKPETGIPEWVKRSMGKIDVILVMTVNPGFSGQKLLRSVIPKISNARNIVNELSAGCDVEVDGGVEPENADELVRSGATILVAGASVFRKGSVSNAMKELRRSIKSEAVAR